MSVHILPVIPTKEDVYFNLRDTTPPDYIKLHYIIL